MNAFRCTRELELKFTAFYKLGLMRRIGRCVCSLFIAEGEL